MKELRNRLARLTKEVAERFAPPQFMVVEAIEVGNAGGRPCGLYSDGILVYDPAAGEPTMPSGFGDPLLIVGEGATIENRL